jgi:CheY-like chemotaxis protein
MATATDRDKASKEKLLIQVLRKIPIFNCLAPTQVRKIIGLCQHKSCKPGERVCDSGTKPDEMFVLLSGELAIITPEGLKVATILPVTTVGEMGVITGQPRVASVEASKPSALFTIHKVQFDAILRDDQDMQAKVYRAIIDVLSGKLSNDNVRLRDYHMERARYEGRIAVLQRRLKENESRAAIALDLAADKTGMDRDELGLHVEEQVKDLVPRILIVDDEQDFRLLVKDALPGFEVVEEQHGKEALDVIRDVKLYLVITDINIPEMDGVQLLEKLRAQFPAMKILAASGYLDADQVRKHPFDGFIEKPLALEPFQRLVEQTLGILDT